MTTPRFRTIEVQEGDGQTSTVQVPVSPAAPSTTSPSTTEQQRFRTVTVQEGDGQTSTIQVPIDDSGRIQVAPRTEEERRQIEQRATSQEIIQPREQTKVETRRQRIELERREVELRQQREQTLKTLQSKTPIGRTVIPDRNVASFLGKDGKNIETVYPLKNGDTIYYLKNGRVVIFTSGKEGIARFELLSPKAAEKIKSDQILRDIIAANPNVPAYEIAEALAQQRLEGQQQAVQSLGDFGKEVGLSLIPIYGTYRDAKRLNTEWDDLSNAERARDTAFTTLSAVGDVTLVFGTASKLSSIALKTSTKTNSVVLKATTDSVSEAIKLAETVKRVNKLPPQIEVVSSSNPKYLSNVANLSENVSDGKRVFEIAIEPTERGIRDAGVVDDLLKGRDEALELAGRSKADAPKIQRNTQGVIEVDKPLSDIEIKKLADAVRGDTEINNIRVRAVENPGFTGDTLERVVDERMLLWKRQNPRASKIQEATARSQYSEKLSPQISEGRTVEDSARLLQNALKKKSVSQRSGVVPSEVRQAVTRRDIKTTLEVDKAVPLDSPAIIRKENELRKLKERLAKADDNIDEEKLLASANIEDLPAVQRALEQRSTASIIRKIEKLEDEIKTLRTQQRAKEIETRAIRLEPEGRRTPSLKDDNGGGVAVLTKTDDLTSLRFNNAYRTATQPKTVKEASAISNIFLADFSMAQTQEIPSPSRVPTGTPSGAPGPGEAPTPREEPSERPEPKPEPEPQPKPEPKPKPDPSRVRVDEDTGRATRRTSTMGRLPSIESGKIEIDGRSIPIEGTVAWKQGFGWYVLYPPYRQSNLFFTRQRPIGIVIRKDAESAVRYIILSGGNIPKNTRLKIGAFTLQITSRGREPEFEFKRIKRVR